jgi:hypothetical protein
MRQWTTSKIWATRRRKQKLCVLKGWELDNVKNSSHLTKNTICFRKSVVLKTSDYWQYPKYG